MDGPYRDGELHALREENKRLLAVCAALREDRDEVEAQLAVVSRNRDAGRWRRIENLAAAILMGAAAGMTVAMLWGALR